MYVDGRHLNRPIDLEGKVDRVRVRLRRSGIGITTGETCTPRIWFNHALVDFHYDPSSGSVDIEERRESLSIMNGGESPNAPLLRLDLPRDYEGREIARIDLDVRREAKSGGYAVVEVGGLAVAELSVNTWGPLALHDLDIGRTCFAKTVQGDVYAEELLAPLDTGPHSVELISVLGRITLKDSEGAWNLTAGQINVSDTIGPMQATRLSR